jgi:hypothetical protein
MKKWWKYLTEPCDNPIYFLLAAAMIAAGVILFFILLGASFAQLIPP